MWFQFFLQFDRNMGYFTRTRAPSCWTSGVKLVRVQNGQKWPKKTFFTTRPTSGVDAKNSEKTQKNRIAQLLDEWGIYGAILDKNCPSKCLFNFIFYLKKSVFLRARTPTRWTHGRARARKKWRFLSIWKKNWNRFSGFLYSWKR